MHGALRAMKQESVFMVDVGTKRNADIEILMGVYQKTAVGTSQFVHQLGIVRFWIVIYKILC